MDGQTNIGLFTQHTAEEFDMKLYKVDSKDTSSPIDPNAERTWVAQHEHDDEVGSFAIEREGDVDMDLMNAWLSKLLAEKGIDIFRMKGFVSIAGESRRRQRQMCIRDSNICLSVHFYQKRFFTLRT